MGAERMRSAFAALALVACVAPAPAAAVEPSPEAREEIQHLLAHLAGSGCEFYRNGSWYGAGEAKDHLAKKYDYLLKKCLVGTAEDFIRLGATESSTSGKPYQVRCAGKEPVASATWLGEELARDRHRRPAAK